MTGKKPTGRTKQLSLKTTPKFHQRLKELAVKEKRLMIEVLEQALKLYEQIRKERKKSVKENAAPQISIEPVIRNKRSRDDDVTKSPDSSKKRKISDY
jgi:hypothetical protein